MAEEIIRDGYSAPLGKYIDFHCHMLPAMDDGADNLETGLEMIDRSVRQGVCGIVFTPHFYALSDSPELFLERRAQAFSLVRENLTSRFPVLVCGAEVQYFDGITVMDGLERLRIGKTDLLMIEMPFRRWSSRVIENVLSINEKKNLRVVIAHIERYIFDQPSGVLDELIGRGVVIQSNAEFFTGRFTRRRALKLLEEGKIHILGSDSHNMRSRSPNLGEAFSIIGEKLGSGAVERIIRNEMNLLTKKDV